MVKIDLKEIFVSYFKRFNPTEVESELAEKRFNICSECPEKTGILNLSENRTIFKCNNCGCPLSGKVYSPKFNACPLKKWEVVDKESPIFKTKKLL